MTNFILIAIYIPINFVDHFCRSILSIDHSFIDALNTYRSWVFDIIDQLNNKLKAINDEKKSTKKKKN